MNNQAELSQQGYTFRQDEPGFVWVNQAKEIEGEHYFPSIDGAIADCNAYINSEAGRDSIESDDDNWDGLSEEDEDDE
jgi:hypothetical protein